MLSEKIVSGNASGAVRMARWIWWRAAVRAFGVVNECATQLGKQSRVQGISPSIGAYDKDNGAWR